MIALFIDLPICAKGGIGFLRAVAVDFRNRTRLAID
jgi:hypothetical protein